MDKNFENVYKQLAGLPDGILDQNPSWLPALSPAAWTGVKAIENHWLWQQNASVMPSDTILQLLDQQPYTGTLSHPVPGWLDSILGLSPKVDSFFTQITGMTDGIADILAGPLAGIEQFGEELVRPVQGLQQLVDDIPSLWDFGGFWQDLQPALHGFMALVEEAEEGREVLQASEFGFADHLWGLFYARMFARIDPQVRNATVTNMLASYTRSDEFVGQLIAIIDESKLLRKRRRIIESACEAHAERKYDLSVPAILAQIEGTLVNMMFLRDLVKKEGGRFFLVDENGDFKLNKNKRRLPAVTLGPAITSAKLDEHPDLGAASEFMANTLVQRRNAVLHGHDLSYGKAKFSVQALLLLAVLAEAVSELESGDID